MRASRVEHDKEIHISGAEGIYKFDELERFLKKFFKRATEHPNGFPDKIFFTLEKIKEQIQFIKALPIKTVFCETPEKAKEIINEHLTKLGISEKAITTGWNVIKGQKMRGAALIDCLTGVRIEPNKERGVRVSRIHMDKKRKIQVLRKIKNLTSEPQRVIEAVTVASKVASCSEVVAEICVSDNLNYTTGYIASKEFGYLRITNIKKHGEAIGGRAFFVKTPLKIDKLIKFLEKTPVIVI
ncbi:6-carboxyhexanoate--CoA ligase [Thermodesulfovibrio sp. 3907-1M]|uniref:6-carboxyhexanoate--CoA ligase n=1 Tax=Thermodesulfovibrio autotrophicus TaxID=3118333 RepID=A0AAU8H004_9BACT